MVQSIRDKTAFISILQSQVFQWPRVYHSCERPVLILVDMSTWHYHKIHKRHAMCSRVFNLSTVYDIHQFSYGTEKKKPHIETWSTSQ
jgi:hypothetical protein